MSHEIVVYKGRTNTIIVDLGIDVSDDTFASSIRAEPDLSAALIMDWEVEFDSDGSDGLLVLTVDNTITAQIKQNSGYMDIKRVSGSEPLPVFDRPVEVQFIGAVTE